MPLYLIYLQLPPEEAKVTQRDKFVINADYTVSNISVSAFTAMADPNIDPPTYDIQMDLEVSRVTLDFRYGLYDSLEVGLEVPFISFSKGYLDNFIEGFEDAIGARTPRSPLRTIGLPSRSIGVSKIPGSGTVAQTSLLKNQGSSSNESLSNTSILLTTTFNLSHTSFRFLLTRSSKKLWALLRSSLAEAIKKWILLE
ncbi:DUF3187 family protein [Candidatus Omnitrophota bacterium]